jgi:hypothetical protein
MKKIIFVLFACIACLQSASAQDYYESSSDIYGLGETNYQKAWTRAVNLSIGDQVNVGFTFRRNFGKYFAWDVWHFGYAYDYSERKIWHDGYKSDVTHEITIFRTGIRLFTPNLGKVKFFAATGWGFDYSECDYPDNYYKDSSWKPGMGISLEAGLYIGKRFNIAYQATFHRCQPRINHTDNMIRFGIDF